MNKEQNAALDEIRAEFPLFDDADLDQEKHHCEWSVQHDRKRLNALLDTLQARAQLASDGMCNADNPANRCICREEFGYRVCVSASDAVQVPRELGSEWPKQECPVTGAVTDVEPEDMGMIVLQRDKAAHIESVLACPQHHTRSEAIAAAEYLRALLNGGRV
jgi:hypothetical protein